ncbi:MAG: hypothetical protein AB1529_08400 [Candidatus Micrarchaeota archaeon]
MITEISGLLDVLHLAAGVGFLAAVAFALKLYLETDKGWYWLSLVLSAVFFALAHWSSIIFPISLENFEFLAIIQETSEIVASILLSVSCYGIYKTMKEIRKRVE